MGNPSMKHLPCPRFALSPWFTVATIAKQFLLATQSRMFSKKVHNFRMKQQNQFTVYRKRAHPDLNQGPADLQSAALTTELCTHVVDIANFAMAA
jgi:hypothetical protein